jgi:hypothetical protein
VRGRRAAHNPQGRVRRGRARRLDCLHRRLAGAVLGRFEQKGLLLLLAGLVFVVTALACAVVPTLEQTGYDRSPA